MLLAVQQRTVLLNNVCSHYCFRGSGARLKKRHNNNSNICYFRFALGDGIYIPCCGLLPYRSVLENILSLPSQCYTLQWSQSSPEASNS